MAPDVAVSIVPTWDALRLESMVHVIAVIAYNFALLLYLMIQRAELRGVIALLRGVNGIERDIWVTINPLSIALQCVVALGIIVQAFMAWKLFQQYSWLRHHALKVKSDVGLNVKYQTFQVYSHLHIVEFTG